MKKIEAIIKPFKLENVKAALGEAGFSVLRVLDVQESSRQTHQELYAGTEYQVDVVPKAMLVLYVDDEKAAAAVHLIQEAIRPWGEGDAMIAVSSVEQLIHVSQQSEVIIA